MKIILLYNPTAGEEDFPLGKIISSLENQGARVLAQNTTEEKFEKVFDLIFDLIIIAGGDGTVEKILLEIRDTNIPIAILPYGNANNIACSLGLTSDYENLVKKFEQKKFHYLSIGKYETPEKTGWFIEGIGWGIFTALLLQIERDEKKVKDSTSKVDFGLKNLKKLPDKLPVNEYQIELDGEDYSGKYIWVEIMNTRRLGPQLALAPDADHSDKYLDIMLVKKSQKSELKEFLKAQKKAFSPSPFQTLKAKKIKVQSQLPFHVDDDLMQHSTLYEGVPEVKVTLAKGQLKILQN
ncbi:diacylglycerol kinase family protein [Algoriphagus halophytocola]|uniref:Diacylglycerol kinase family protein n=1 Tax=Algoriphagus halophytocola TaxID=2991499 RepID=A0ABY6MGI7_9BACT|nr:MULTISPECIES: diacylglycerol kinase family protein [unclassified Algoriphagus]UZD22917.1 diacylglycerol kinase family protein [Algoriphagus sp. TR-M5]WBL44185.1 diacylglycerol kinase family protein [Algoriphagus sp. TR-M9]